MRIPENGIIIGDVSRSKVSGVNKVHPDGVKGLKQAVKDASNLVQLKAAVLGVLKFLLREA